MILSQLIPIFECKSETKSLFHLPLWNNWKLLVAVAVSAGILVCSDGKFGSTDDFHDCSAVAATLEQLEVAGCGFCWYLVCSGEKFGSTDDFHDCSAVAATLDCCCSFFVCHSDLLGDSIPNHCKEKGRTIKKQPLSLKKDCFFPQFMINYIISLLFCSFSRQQCKFFRQR